MNRLANSEWTTAFTIIGKTRAKRVLIIRAWRHASLCIMRKAVCQPPEQLTIQTVERLSCPICGEEFQALEESVDRVRAAIPLAIVLLICPITRNVNEP